MNGCNTSVFCTWIVSQGSIILCSLVRSILIHADPYLIKCIPTLGWKSYWVEIFPDSDSIKEVLTLRCCVFVAPLWNLQVITKIRIRKIFELERPKSLVHNSDPLWTFISLNKTCFKQVSRQQERTLSLSTHDYFFVRKIWNNIESILWLFFRYNLKVKLMTSRKSSGDLNNQHLSSGLLEIWYSDARFLILTGQENSGQSDCYSGHHSNNKLK